MANPFYVEPVDVSPLMQLGSVIGERREAKAAQERQDMAMEELQGALRGGAGAIAQFSLKYPELSQLAQQQFGFTNEQSKQAARDGYSQALLTEDPQVASDALYQAARDISAAGGDPQNTLRDAEMLASGDLTLEEMKQGVAFSQPDLYKTYEKLTKEPEIDPALAIKQAELEIKQADAKEKSLDRALQREINEVKKKELQQLIKQNKLDKEKKKREIEVQGEQAVEGVDFGLSVADELLNHPGLEAAVGASSILPSLPGGEAANFEAKLEQFQSQQFLNNIEKMKGLGALSEAEGRKVAAAAGALRLDMSEKAMKRELETIISNLNKAKGFLQKKYNIETEVNPRESLSSTNKPVFSSAPPKAIEYLKLNPESINQFEEKYGYRPEGF